MLAPHAPLRFRLSESPRAGTALVGGRTTVNFIRVPVLQLTPATGSRGLLVERLWHGYDHRSNNPSGPTDVELFHVRIETSPLALQDLVALTKMNFDSARPLAALCELGTSVQVTSEEHFAMWHPFIGFNFQSAGLPSRPSGPIVCPADRVLQIYSSNVSGSSDACFFCAVVRDL